MGIVRTIFLFLGAFITNRSTIAAENLALRHQLGVLQRSVKRPRLRQHDLCAPAGPATADPQAGQTGQVPSAGYPTVTDHLVQMASKNVLEPIFEADFYPTSYGARRGRSTMDALTTIQHRLNPTHLAAR